MCLFQELSLLSCKEYERLDGEFFKSFMTEHFPRILRKSKKVHSCLFIQDGDPGRTVQRHRKLLHLSEPNCWLHHPEAQILMLLKLFVLVRKHLDIEAFEQKMTHETFNQYTARVKSTLYSMNKAVIDNIIGSMCRRIDLIVKNEGTRAKY